MQFIFSISGLVNFIATILIALFVLFNNRKPLVNKIFLLLVLSNSVWSYGYWQWLTIYDNPIEALFWVRVLTIGSVLTSLFCLHWIILLLNINSKKLIWSYYLLTAVYSIYFFSDNFVSGVRKIMYFSYWPTPGPIYNLYLITHYLILIPFLILIIAGKLKSHEGTKKMQLYYVMAGSFLGFAAAGSNFFLWYGLKIPPFGNFIVFLYPMIFAYAMFKYRLMDIRTIVAKIYTYSSTAIFTCIFFYLLFDLENKIFKNINSLSAIIATFIFIVLYVVALFPLINKIQRSSDIIFFRGNNPSKILKDLALELSGSIDLIALVKKIIISFKSILAAETVEVFILKKISKKTFCVSALDNKKRINLESEIYKFFLNSKTVLARDEINTGNQSTLAAELDELNVKIITPLIVNSALIGFILLGNKIGNDSYTQEDIDFLQVISAQIAIAVENADLHKEAENFNKTLQKKVNEQTKELVDKAAHLEKLMEMRSEFLDITSHQLRTPVTVIKGVISMIQEGSVPKERQEEFLNMAMDKSIKLGEIINDILRASEMDTEKFTMTIRPVDLNEIMEKIKSDKMRTALIRKVVLSFNFTKDPLPMVMTDPKYIEQAIVNLINNSFQYTPEGTIDVSTEVKDNKVIIRVADTGIGIPEKDRVKLFHKFGRAENAVQTFTDGSGLGLFIIKQIVDANPGAKIEIERTEIGKGTTFALTLPVAKEVVSVVTPEPQTTVIKK